MSHATNFRIQLSRTASASNFRGCQSWILWGNIERCEGSYFTYMGWIFEKGRKGEEKKELNRGLHILSSIAWSVSSRVKARFFWMVDEESAEIITTATRNGKISGGRWRCSSEVEHRLFSSVQHIYFLTILFPHYVYLYVLGWLLALMLLLLMIVLSQFICVDTMDLSFRLPNRFAIHTSAHCLFRLLPPYQKEVSTLFWQILPRMPALVINIHNCT